MRGKGAEHGQAGERQPGAGSAERTGWRPRPCCHGEVLPHAEGQPVAARGALSGQGSEESIQEESPYAGTGHKGPPARTPGHRGDENDIGKERNHAKSHWRRRRERKRMCDKARRGAWGHRGGLRMKDKHNSGRGLQQDNHGPCLKDTGQNSGPGDERSITNVELQTPTWPSSSKRGPEGEKGSPRQQARGGTGGWGSAACPSHGHDPSAQPETIIQTSLHRKCLRAQGLPSGQKACRQPRAPGETRRPLSYRRPVVTLS